VPPGSRPADINRPPTVVNMPSNGLLTRQSQTNGLFSLERVMVFRMVVVVREYERGLFYRDGKFVELLPPGRYVHWTWEHCQIDPVDIREVSQTVEGQEILTADKIGIRVTLIAQFKVVDPVAARHSVGDYSAQLYQDLQLTLREAITGRTLEELLNERDLLSARLQADVAPRAINHGVELTRVGVKDMVLPGAVRAMFLQEVEAEHKGRASLVAARHEVAAARARANTAKLLQENPQILRLQELETLAQLASKSGNVLIIPGLQGLLSRAAGPDSSQAKPLS
jgi:regulator of protease activity HflC (stomatin/prohibitin superfamily)